MKKGMLLLTTIFFSLCFAGIIFSQQNKIDDIFEIKAKESPFEIFFQKVMDQIFPFYHGLGKTGQNAFILRYFPSFHPESQIIIRLSNKSEVTINYKAARVHFRTGDYNIEEVARQMDVSTKMMNVSSDIYNSWLNKFWDAYSKSTSYLKKSSMSDMLVFDGTGYHLEYYGPQTHIAITIQGSELNEITKEDAPIVQWMSLIKKEIEKLSTNVSDSK
jgi:hypothetical protein